MRCQVHERHRHRYEVNPSVVAELEAAGMKLVGRNNDGTGERMEVLELEEDAHPYFMGAQVCFGVFSALLLYTHVLFVLAQHLAVPCVRLAGVLLANINSAVP